MEWDFPHSTIYSPGVKTTKEAAAAFHFRSIQDKWRFGGQDSHWDWLCCPPRLEFRSSWCWFSDLRAGIYHCLLDFPLGIISTGGAARNRGAGDHQATRTQWSPSLVFENLSEEPRLSFFPLFCTTHPPPFDCDHQGLALCTKHIFIKPCKQVPTVICKCKQQFKKHLKASRFYKNVSFVPFLFHRSECVWLWEQVEAAARQHSFCHTAVKILNSRFFQILSDLME